MKCVIKNLHTEYRNYSSIWIKIGEFSHSLSATRSSTLTESNGSDARNQPLAGLGMNSQIADKLGFRCDCANDHICPNEQLVENSH
jgi:hypothetical protein